MNNKYKYFISAGVFIVCLLVFCYFYDKNGKDATSAYNYGKQVKMIQNTLDSECSDALEMFYQDSDYVYYFPCMMSSRIIAFYNDGTQKYVRDALNDKDITISDLDTYGIKYIKEAVKTDK